MLFTDGGEERAQAILEKYNVDKKVTSRTRDLCKSHSDELLLFLSVCCLMWRIFKRLSFSKLPLGFSICMRFLRTLKIQTGSRRSLFVWETITYLHTSAHTHAHTFDIWIWWIYVPYRRHVLSDWMFFFQVRIFTFSVGQHNYDKGPIQWMACSNKGA